MKISTKQLAQIGMSAAIVFVVTFLVRIPVPGTQGGYINFGDIAIYISAYLLGGPAGAIAAAIGSGAADIAAGAPVYAAGTFVIKGVMGLLVGLLAANKGLSRFAAAATLAGAGMVAGYALYELALFGGAYALTAIPMNLVQMVGCSVVATVVYPVARRVKLHRN
ncbi:MAG: ECF transporter S component [Oscillospiraceae bacterium]|jgi:uncharacterized membrane protein|nr:ECF transporter S component [Oscillospiraceae bacterium]